MELRSPPVFRSWSELFCPGSPPCPIEAAIYFNLFDSLNVSAFENAIDDYVTKIDAVWLRPNLIELPTGGQQKIQRYLEKKGRQDLEAKEIAKIYQTYDNKTKQSQMLYESVLKAYNEALIERRDKLHVDYLTDFSSIEGTYPTSEKAYWLHITSNPEEMLFKSQGRPWEGESCERWAGIYGEGFFADIAFGNLLAFIIDETGTPIARKMIRWAEGLDYENEIFHTDSWSYRKKEYAKKACLNLEPNWYGQLGVIVQEHETRNAFYQSLDLQMKNLFEQYGFFCEESKTPYGITGYSDKGKGPGMIEYNWDEHAYPEQNEYMERFTDHGYTLIYTGELGNDQIQALIQDQEFVLISPDEAIDRALEFWDLDELRIEDLDELKDLVFSHILEDTDYTTDMEFDFNVRDGVYARDEANPYFEPLINDDAFYLTQQARKIAEYMHLNLEDQSYIEAVFLQYNVFFKQLNLNAEDKVDLFGLRASWVGNMEGSILFYNKEDHTLFTDMDSIFRERILREIRLNTDDELSYL